MSLTEYLGKMKQIQSVLLEYIKGDDNETNFQKFLKLFNDFQFINNKYDFKLILLLIIRISNNMHRPPLFYEKIFQILSYFKADIIKNFSNCEIFNIFGSNKRIILFLIDNQIITVDKPIATKMCNVKNDSKYQKYFCQEIKPFNDSIRARKMSKELHESFEKWRRIGENETKICQLIREDLLDDFIVYVHENNFSLTYAMKPSFFETNSFLQNRLTTLIEYSAFFGSFKIFKHLHLQNVKLTSILYLCAIHGENPEIIDFLENNLPLQNIPNLANDCYFEAIKCYNDQMAYYFESNYLQSKNLIDLSSHLYSYDFLYNFEFIDEKMIGNLSFEKLCQTESHFYCQIYLLQNPSTDINKITEVKEDNEAKPKEYEYGPSDLYIKFLRQSRSKQEKPLLIQMIEKGYTDIVQVLINQLNTDVNIEFTFRRFCHRWEYEYNCMRINMLGRDDEDEIESKVQKKSALIIAIENNNDEIVQLLLNNPKINVNTIKTLSRIEEVQGWQNARWRHVAKEKITQIEKPALYIAIQNNNIEIVKILLQHPDIDINLRYKNKKKIGYNQYSSVKKTALHFAIEKNNVDMVKLLLQNKNIDVNAVFIRKGKIVKDNHEYEDYNDYDENDEEYGYCFLDKYNEDYYDKYDKLLQRQVALHMAVQNNNIEIVKLLLQNPKIDVNVEYDSNDDLKKGKTALHFAVANDNDEIVKLLLQNQFINIYIKDSKGNTPIDLAKSENIKKLILDYK